MFKTFLKHSYRFSLKKKENYLTRPIATFMNAAIDLTYSHILKTQLKPLINMAIERKPIPFSFFSLCLEQKIIGFTLELNSSCYFILFFYQFCCIDIVQH